MSITSLSTNQAALVAQLNISNANTNVTNDVTELSSGSRIVSAATDVAALSTGTALQSQVNVLNAAQSVASQGSSLLQVADGGLAQIQTILQRQQSIATSAQSGTLSDTQRGFLDQEFQSLTSQINQLASSTNFNGVNLLDGSLSQSLNSNTSTTASTQASASYTITANAAINNTIKINGQAFTFGAAAGDITVGSDINSTTANLASFINNAASNTGLSTAQKTALSAISASQVGTSGTLSLTARSGGSLGGAVTIGGIGGGGSFAISATGANVGTTQAINNIAVASTSTALTSVTTGGFIYGGQLLYSGTTGSSTALVDSTGNAISITNTTTLQSLAAQINSGTSKSGVSAYITGASGNYSLNLSSSNSSGGTAVTAANSSALALGNASVALTSTNATGIGTSSGPLLSNAVGAVTAGVQSFTFNGITSASTVLTEGNSGLANGQISINISGATASQITGTGVVLGTTTLNTLVSDINAYNTANATGVTANLTTTASGQQVLNIVNALGAGSGEGITSGGNHPTLETVGAFSNYAATRTGDATFAVGSSVANGVVALGGGQNTGLGYGSTTAVGSVLNPILTAQNQQAASTKIVFPSIQPGDLDSSSYFGSATTITIGTNVGSTDNAATTFTFSANADSASATEIQIGSTLQQTLANAAAKINSFEGNGAQNYVFNQLQATSDGNSITISSKTAQNVYQNDQSTAVTVSASGSSTAVTNATLNNAANGGVDASTINNSAFTGTISGITATANGTANQVNLSVKIGNITYAANNVSTNPLSNTAVQLVSTDPTGAGGYFTLNLQALNGQNVVNQTDANTYAANLNTALSGLSFYQTRQVSSYNPAASGGSIIANGQAIGSLNGSSISATSNDFSNFNFTGISVAAPSGSNANGTITITANGQNYVSSPNIGTSLAANTSYTLTSTSNPNQTITFKTGSNSIDISSPANATAVQNALTSAFGSSGSAISFQVGSTSSQSIGVSIGSASTSALFGGQSLDVKTLSDATNAGNVITTALNTVTALRATVGALEERFTYASNAISSAVQNQGAAQSNLLDTDVSSASTSFSTAQVQLQAGIAVLAQANQLQQQLTKLIQ